MRAAASQDAILRQNGLDTLHHADIVGENAARLAPLKPVAFVKKGMDLMAPPNGAFPDYHGINRAVRSKGERKAVEGGSHGASSF
jgi:hypothetical protein